MSRVARVSCRDYDDAAKALQRGFQLLGGVEKYAARGEKILVKPNLLAPFGVKKAVTTHPAVLDAALGILADLGAKASVGDSPGIGTASYVAKISGMAEVCKRHSVPLLDLGKCPVREVDVKGYRGLPLSEEVWNHDGIWNLAKWKTHSMMGLTLGVKNLYGLVPGAKKIKGHMRAGEDRDAFAGMLLEIAQVVKPRLTILDGIIAMEGAGPSNGTPLERNLLLLAENPYALDFEAARLSGFTPGTIPTVRLSLEKGFFFPEKLEVLGDDAEVLNFLPAPGSPTDFGILPKFLRRLLRRIISPPPLFSRELCENCGVCVGACPVEALSPGLPPAIRKDACIRCYCCQELCPKGAVSVSVRLANGHGRRR